MSAWEAPCEIPPFGELLKLFQLDQPILRAWSCIRGAPGDHPQDTKGSLCILPCLFGLTSPSIAYVCLEMPCLFPEKQDGFKPSVYQQGWQLILPGENWEPSSLLSSWNCIAKQTAPWLSGLVTAQKFSLATWLLAPKCVKSDLCGWWRQWQGWYWI